MCLAAVAWAKFIRPKQMLTKIQNKSTDYLTYLQLVSRTMLMNNFMKIRDCFKQNPKIAGAILNCYVKYSPRSLNIDINL